LGAESPNLYNVKTLIKLLIAAAIVNAVARVGFASARYYQFKDESQELVTFSANAAPGELQNDILEKATALNLPVAFEDIEVTREGQYTRATASYTEDVEVFPKYIYPIAFRFTVQGINLGGVSGGPPVNK
jgi:hypothetical protein